MTEWREYRELEEIERGEHSIERSVQILAGQVKALGVQFKDFSTKLDQLIQVLVPPEIPATDLNLTQENQNMGVITGIKAGATGSFALSTLPAGSLLQAGSIPTYASDNEVDVSALVPAADGMSFSVSAAATFTAGVTSFNVTATAISLPVAPATTGATLTKVFNIPLIAPVVVGVPATDLDLNQTV